MMTAYQAPALTKAAARQLDQGMFDFLVPYRKPVLLPSEAARSIGRSVDFVRDLIQGGQLESLEQAAKGERKVYLVTRRSVLCCLAKSANFEPADFDLCLTSLVESLDAARCEHLIRVATARRIHLHR